ncbi:GerMN domain-containing protein [Brachybacterium sp. Z12]|uniref:LpqB family beta-propeller domain-containing protein n=1 Tax=Brachybacterium sp. Z12 TaxID=2759167 RepID=UPI001860EE9A|nr:LpqB family beta-propeller domain-containing protein [Brachybacterium sp. Z12]QNN81831.1 GerMN domain-containing protein [Brachybacterium sp. Z12]
MRPARRQVLRAAGAAAVIGLGAACARIPTDSPVDTRLLSGQSQPGAPYVRALPPPHDATAQEVVAGFVQAGVGSEDDFAVARAYLTGDASGDWDPSAGISVYSGSQELKVEEVDEGRLALVLQVVALVDGQGVRSLLAGPVSREIEVAIEQVDGQWRLSEVPDGIFLSEAAFETLYGAARIYFLDARELHLVPDHRWFPLRRGASAVLEALVDGPATFLEGAVTSRIPRASSVAEAVITTAADGTAQVAVPAAIAGLAHAPRMLALSQLEASLRSLRTMSGVRLVMDGQEVVLDEQERIERALPGHRPLAAGQTGIISLADPGASTPAAQLVPDLEGTEVSSPVIAHDGVLAAARNPEGSVVLIASTDGSVPVREAATGGAFVAPSIDDAGFVWTSTGSSAGALLALSGQGAELDAKVDAPWLTGREVRSVRIAADGTRMLVLSADGGGARLDLCAVVRDTTGTPTSLTEPVIVRTSLAEVTEAGWYDEIAMVVLGTDSSTGDRRAQIVDFASGLDVLPSLASGTEKIAGSVVAESVWIGTADGVLLRSDGETWMDVDIEGSDPSFY